MEHTLAAEEAKLNLHIQDLRRELNGLIADKEVYLTEREKDATKRITDALKASHKTIKQTDEYVAAVKEMVALAQSIIEEIKAARQAAQAEHRQFTDEVAKTRKLLDAKVKELEAFKAEVSLQTATLNGIKESVAFERAALALDQRKLDDDRKKLKSAMDVWKLKETKTE